MTAALTIGSLAISTAQLPAAKGATTSGLAAQAAAIADRVSADSSALSTIGVRYLAAVAAYHSDLITLASTRQALTRTAASITQERILVDSAAVEAYVASGAENAVGLYLANQPDRTTITDAYLGMATREVNATIATLGRDRTELSTEQVTEELVTSLAAKALGESRQARDSALATLVSEQTTLSSVKGRLAALVQAQEVAAQRAAEERAAAAEAAAQAAAAAASKTATTSPAPSRAGPPASSAITSISPTAGPPSSLAADFAAIRRCEASNDYSLNTGNGYYGAYQFAYQTWIDLGESGLPSAAPPATQDAAAYKLYLESGWSSWPACAVITGLE
jgi:Transglycosylase-like domain